MESEGRRKGSSFESSEKRKESKAIALPSSSLRVGHFAPLSTTRLEKKTKKNEKPKMHVLGLHRGSGYNIPEGPNKGEGAPTRIGRYEITSKNDLKQSFDGGASLPLERWVCEFSPSFTSDSLSNPGREASLLTVLKRGVVVVSSSSAAARRGGGGGGANEGRAKTTEATTATKEALVTSETTLSPGQTAVVHPGDVLYFQGCPRDLVGLRVLPGPAEKDAQELDRREREERKKKRKHAEEATAAAAAAVGAKEEAAEAKRERARGVLLRTPEPFHRWHLSFFNTRFSSQLEQWCRDEGATVTRLLLFDCEKGEKRKRRSFFSSVLFLFVSFLLLAFLLSFFHLTLASPPLPQPTPPPLPRIDLRGRLPLPLPCASPARNLRRRQRQRRPSLRGAEGRGRRGRARRGRGAGSGGALLRGGAEEASGRRSAAASFAVPWFLLLGGGARLCGGDWRRDQDDNDAAAAKEQQQLQQQPSRLRLGALPRSFFPCCRRGRR